MATDTGEAGIASYSVQVKVGAGSWTDWLVATPATQGEYAGEVGQSYTFRVQALDRVGNPSPWVESGPCQPAVTKYYHFGSQPVAMRRGTGTMGALTYLHGDHLGSVSLATSPAGAVVSDSPSPITAAGRKRAAIESRTPRSAASPSHPPAPPSP